MRKTLVLFVGFLLLITAYASAESVGNDYLKSLTIEGAGASFPYPIYSKWASEYHKRTGMKLNYQPIGSGGGIRQITAKTVHFGASDTPLKIEELDKLGLMQFPMIIGGVVPVINIPGVKPGSVKLSPSRLADIFLGKVTNWKHARIVKENKGISFPDMDITVVHRSDGSGTTWIFTNYLSKVSNEWKNTVGNNKSVQWETGIGGKGNDGVAAFVKQIEGTIGYVEYAYALQNKLSHIKLRNRSGKFVNPTAETFQAAAANANWQNTPGYYVVLTDQPGDESWPIVGASFILMYKEQKNWKRARAILQYFDWCFRSGDKFASQLDYVPIPKNVYQMVEQSWASQIMVSGKPLWKAEIAYKFQISPEVKKQLVGLTLEGAGASFPYPIYSKWASDFNKEFGMKLNYQPIGSGGGIRQISAKTIAFGASDKPLESEKLNELGLMQFPMIIGGVVPVVNIPGVKPGDLKLTPELLADIFLGKITNWNDPRIKAVNGKVSFPDSDITVVHRSDGSGTTWIFTNYLSKVSKEWASKVGNEKSVEWPAGIGGKGNDGIAAFVKQIEGTIGYVEYAYAIQNKLSHTCIKNKDGNFVAPTASAFQAAAANADWKNAPGYYVVLTDQSGAETWPIVGSSFILIYKQQEDIVKARAMLAFFAWCLHNGAESAKKLDYVPVPLNVVEMIKMQWAQSVKCSGKPCWK